MALTTESSDQMDRVEGAVPKVNPLHEWGGALRIRYFSFTQGAAAGDANSTATLCRLPAGKCRVVLPLSRIHVSALGTSRTLDLGHAAYTEADGTAVDADEDDLDAAVDVSAAVAFNPGGTLGTHETKLFDSQEGVDIVAKIEAGTLPAAATISGYLVYVCE